MTGIIFNSVTAFVEQVGRRLQWKYAELDNMICIYIGPQSSALQFKPKINSPHPQYPLMFVTDSSVTYKEAGVAEVSVTYAGIIQTSGASSYITPAIVNVSPVQGSREFTQLYMTPIGAPGVVLVPATDAQGNSIPGVLTAEVAQLYNAGTQSVTVRYVGTQCSVRYQSYPEPSGLKYSSLGKSKVSWTILSQVKGPVSIGLAGTTYQIASEWFTTQYTPIPPLYAANLGSSREQRGQWWDCTEIYGPTF